MHDPDWFIWFLTTAAGSQLNVIKQIKCCVRFTSELAEYEMASFMIIILCYAVYNYR